MKVAVTCIQLIRDLDQWRSRFESAGIEVLAPHIAGQHLEDDELITALSGCIGVVAGDDRFTRRVLEQLPDLRVISKWGIGIDGIDLDAAAEHNITVRNTPGMFNDEVADITMAYVTILARELALVDRRAREGQWYKPAGTSLRGTALGVVGLGGIGRATAVRALAAGMRLIGCDPSAVSCTQAREIGVEVVDFPDLLTQADIIAITCPLTPETYHLFDAAAFGRMRHGVRLVNTGRGAVVDTSALVEALRTGVVRSAALDVMEDEPLPTDSPLLSFDQVVFGSHNASNTLEASARVHERAIDHLLNELGLSA